jgi:hypothetical protein
MYLIGGALLAGGGVMVLRLFNVIASCGNACNNQEFPGDQGDDAARRCEEACDIGNLRHILLAAVAIDFMFSLLAVSTVAAPCARKLRT